MPSILIAAGAALFEGISAIGAAVGSSAVASFAARTLLTIGISRLLSNSATTDASAGQSSVANARLNLGPSTVNQLPVVYGTAWVGTTLIDAIITTDQTTMYYVYALSEVTNSMTGETADAMSYSLSDGVKYNGDLAAFDATDRSKVISLTNNAVPAQTDTKIAGYLNMYFFTNGSFTGVNTGGLSAIQILSDSSIPTTSQWTSTDVMTNTAFMIVKVVYNQNAGTTGQPQSMSIKLTNSRTKPGDVILDYLTNNVYGCAIPIANVDTTSLGQLNTYSDHLITYTPVGGGTATQPRYRINGPINTGQDCLTNLQQLVDACDSWLQYSELTGQWKVVINQSYEQAGQSFSDLYLVDSSVLIGGIDINPIDLNSSYNSLQAQFPNETIQDQAYYGVIQLSDYVPEIMSPNEPNNQLQVSFPQVNNYVQALYLGERKLLQSREDLIITCSLDYSGIQIEAGDVVRVTLAEYGWSNKLFRVSQVQEVKDSNGFLGARITAFQYNDSIYTDNPIQDFVPDGNTGLTNPQWLDLPGKPLISTESLANGTVASFVVSSYAPSVGSAQYMDFNYGTSTDVSTHKLYSSVQTSTGKPFLNSQPASIHVVNLQPNTYYWSVTARTNQTGYVSLASDPYVWTGPRVTNYDPSSGLGGLGWSHMAPSGAGSLVVTGYDVPNYGGSVRTPVAVTSTSSRNIPLIYPGVSVSGTQIFPYAQGTAVDTYPPQGYTVSSTGAWTPASSALEYITISSDGYDGWRQIIFNNLASVTWTTNEVLITQCQLNFYTDTANTNFQLVPYVRYSNQSSFAVLQTQYMSQYTIGSVFPYTSVATPVYNGKASAEVIEFGYYIRNLTVGSNLTCFAGTLSSRQAYPFAGSIF